MEATHEQLSCTTMQHWGSDMHGFDMALEASVAAEVAQERRYNLTDSEDEKERGVAKLLHDELEWAATLAWDRFCGRRG